VSAFADRRFRRLYAGEALSNFGDSALYLALAIWVKDLTGSNSAAGSVFLAMGLPLLLAPFTGRLVDRTGRRRLLIIMNAIAALAVLPLVAVRTEDQLWIVYLVAALYGLASTILSAGKSALLKDMLPDADLASANAALNTLGGILRIGSPLGGAAIYSWAGGPALAVFDALTFLCAIAALSSFSVRESPPEPKNHERLHAQLTAGFRHIHGVPLLSQVTRIGAAAFGIAGLLEILIFAVIEQGLGQPPAFFGVIASVQGIGALAAGLSAAWLLRRYGEARVAGIGITVLGASTAGFAIPWVPGVLVAAVGAGMGITWFVVSWQTSLQRYTPTRVMGRVSTAAGMIVAIPQTSAIALGAAFVAFADYRAMLALVAAVLAWCGLRLLLRPAAVQLADQSLDQVS